MNVSTKKSGSGAVAWALPHCCELWPAILVTLSRLCVLLLNFHGTLADYPTHECPAANAP
jgi:hypothetical protein